jgi:hypothetical protein
MTADCEGCIVSGGFVVGEVILVKAFVIAGRTLCAEALIETDGMMIELFEGLVD